MNAKKRPSDKFLEELRNIRKYFENLPHKVFVKDKNLNYLFCNKNYADDLKISPEDIRGKDDYAFYAKDLAEKYRKDDKRILKTGKPEDLIERYVHNGQERIVSTYKEPITDEKGKTIAVLGFFTDVTGFKKAEEDAVRQNAVLNAINTVFKEALACDTDESLAATCLSIAEDLTGSRFGFIGEINQGGRFDTIALSNPGWDICRLPESEATMLINDMEIRGLWGKVIQDGASLIVNDPPSHPDRVGIPDGHPPLTSFLGVPLRHAGSVIGMMALGNKNGGYDDNDRASAEALSVSIVEALRNKRAEQQLARMAQEILEVSTPVIQVWTGIVIAPLIGMLDSQRAQQFMDRFLARIVETQAEVALLDITGVPTVDTQTGQYLIETISAARLLGTQVVLTGVRSAIAQTLVHLGIDLSGISTRASLSAGLRIALDMLGLQVVTARMNDKEAS